MDAHRLRVVAPTSVHRELVLPNPYGSREPRPVSRATLTLASPHASWLEVHHRADGSVRYLLGAEGAPELAHTHRCLAEVFEGVELGATTTCPFREISRLDTRVLRAVPNARHHYWPMRLLHESDRAGLLLHALSARELLDHEVLLQLLFRRVPFWERGLLTPSYPRFVAEKVQGYDRNLLPILLRRRAEPVYHVEVRAAVRGPTDRHAEEALHSWLRSWTSVHGTLWWDLRPVAGKARPAFLAAFRAHDMARFAARKGRRDLSATELAQVLPIPWREHHPGLAYAGAPRSFVPRERSREDDSARGNRQLEVGQVNGEAVYLPEGWHHLAILGKTRSGKSTLALNLVEQILAHQPDARVILLEPTGAFIANLVERLPGTLGADTVEIDPSLPTYEENGVEKATVPLNLLHIRERGSLRPAELEKRSEQLLGSLLQSIKNAWGEESIGGRAEFVLRAMVQGLLTVEGTNLVDAYTALSNKEALRRLDLLVSETARSDSPLAQAFRQHFPKLDYSITFSSLDKVGKIATNPLLRKTLCQRYQTVGFDQLLGHRLLLLNLAKGTLGTEASTFLGAIFLTQLWSALQERVGPARRPTYLIVDEFHNYAIPAFADMLSEGARLGLHVVAITQFLSRIPDRVRSALVGNVDAWALFSLGAEDMKEAFDIMQGARFGWKPEHFVGGLRPYQAAFATRDALVKVDTRPASAPAPHVDPTRDVVLRSSRRYARREDSQASPLGVTWNEVDALLASFVESESRSRQELSDALHWSLPLVEAVVAFSKADGDLIEGVGNDIGLTDRGSYLRQVLKAARNEGEEHNSLLAHSAAALHRRQVRVRIVPQSGTAPLPDAEFEWHGRTYNLEVECTTLGKPAQLEKNLRKALEAGRRCLVVVADRPSAIAYADAMRHQVSGAELWREFGVAWREGREGLAPYAPGPRKPWGFLTDGIDLDDDEEPAIIAGERVDTQESDLAWTLQRTKELLAAGKWEVPAEAFDGVFGLNDSRDPLSRQRLGFALTALGVRSRRVRRQDGRQERLYDLRCLAETGRIGPGPNPADSSGTWRRDGDDKRSGSAS